MECVYLHTTSGCLAVEVLVALLSMKELMGELLTIQNFMTLGMLTLLQVVLGFDNLLYISIESNENTKFMITIQVTACATEPDFLC